LLQEKMLKMAMVMADFTSAEADELRKALSFHRSEERMKKVTAKMEARMIDKKIEKGVRDRVLQASGSLGNPCGFPPRNRPSFQRKRPLPLTRRTLRRQLLPLDHRRQVAGLADGFPGGPIPLQ